MSDKTGIEWADATWNPVTGCTKVSEGCRNCYAKTFAERFKGTPGHYFEKGFDVTLRPDKLGQPLRWQKPRRIFVNSMSDLFHEEVPFDFIDQVFAVMAICPHHTFQVLTKRPERMLKYLTEPGQPFSRDKFGDISPYMVDWGWISPEDAANIAPPGSTLPRWPEWPLQNVWLGVSVENQKAADERIPLLLQTPAVVRFLSCEPLLGPINLGKWLLNPGWSPSYYDPDNIHGYPNAEPTNEFIQWVITGGESGHKARPMHPDWARSLRDQCQAAGVPFFFKQWGEWLPIEKPGTYREDPLYKGQTYLNPDGTTEPAAQKTWVMQKVGKKEAGRELDDHEWNEFPEVKT